MKLLKFDKETVLISNRNIENYISASISITIKNAIDQHKINLGSTLILLEISVIDYLMVQYQWSVKGCI